MRSKQSKEQRKKYCRERMRRIRKSWTPEQRQANVEKAKIWKRAHPMTPAQLEHHKLYMREYRNQLKILKEKLKNNNHA